MSFRSGATIGDVLKRRGVHTLVYFHTDHFEPWRLIPDRPGGMDRCIEDVETYLRSVAELDFMRHASLFYKANVNYLTSRDRELIRADPDDLLGFVPRSQRDVRIGRGILRPIVESDHDLQVHIHHEYYTFNDTLRDPETFAYLQTPRGRSFDDARLELAIRLGLDTLREDADLILEQWFFIHGHWALNGSDPHECNVVREIEILKRNGCLGDFTQPAGRIHVDSRICVPYLVDPVAAPKGYDTAAANPTPAAGAGGAAADRFFIWASESTHRTCSIDTYSSAVKQRLKSPEATALEHARTSVVIDGVLYLKTHAHSMQPVYWEADGLPMPHADPAIQAELGALFKAADRAGIEVRFQTVSEVYEGLVNAKPSEGRDLVSEFKLDDAHPMEPLGITVEFRDVGGALTEAPVLGKREDKLPVPSIPTRVESTDPTTTLEEEPKVVAHIVPLQQTSAVEFAAVADVTGAAPVEQAFDILELMSAPDVVKVNAGACATTLKILEEIGAEASGVTGYYGPRARQGELLQASEVACAHFVQTRLPEAQSVYEIGCGLGLLTTLLALRGLNAVGVERNRARLTTAQTIADGLLTDRRKARWVRGLFPAAMRREKDTTSSVALVTNLLGSATEEQQTAFIRGLRMFGAVLIDAQRFYDRRLTSKQIEELRSRFTDAGFQPPKLVFDMGPDGHFLLAINPRPLRRPGLGALAARLGLLRAKPILASD